MKLAIIGTGLMGHPMAVRLATQGHSVVAHNRTRSKAADLVRSGVDVAERPEEAVRSGDPIVLMLSDIHAIRSVIESEPVRNALSGRTIIQMGTIGPHESLALQRDVQAVGGDYLEAPVLGSIAEVRAGTLIVMVGGTTEQFHRWSPVFRCLGRDPLLVGPVGQAAALKLALNQLIAAEMAAFALSLGLVQRSGVSHETFMAVLRRSVLHAPTFDKKLPRLLKREYTHPNFSARHLLKDVELVLDAAQAAGLNPAGLRGVPALLTATIEQGLGDMDYSALFNAVNPAGDPGS